MPEIKITDTLRWKQGSSIFKVREGLAMTINALESINGDCNEATPRHNTFWMSIMRLSRAFSHTIENLSCSLLQNFNTRIQRACGQMRAIGEVEMTQQKSLLQNKSREWNM
jgi:hypothetical protein